MKTFLYLMVGLMGVWQARAAGRPCPGMGRSPSAEFLHGSGIVIVEEEEEEEEEAQAESSLYSASCSRQEYLHLNPSDEQCNGERLLCLPLCQHPRAYYVMQEGKKIRLSDFLKQEGLGYKVDQIKQLWKVIYKMTFREEDKEKVLKIFSNLCFTQDSDDDREGLDGGTVPEVPAKLFKHQVRLFWLGRKSIQDE